MLRSAMCKSVRQTSDFLAFCLSSGVRYLVEQKKVCCILVWHVIMDALFSSQDQISLNMNAFAEGWE